MSGYANGTPVELGPAALLDRLREHAVLSGLPPRELEWIAARGVLRQFAADVVVASHDQPVAGLLFVLQGHLAIFVDRGEGRHKVLEWHGGEITGLLPYSRMKTSPGDTLALGPTEAFTVDRDHLPEMIRECPQLTTHLVHVMLDRARAFTSSDLHNEKMKSLGKLAAGLAHELNNPASAVVRSAKLLTDGLLASESASRQLGAAELTPAQHDALEMVRSTCLAGSSPGALSPLEAADRVDAIADWLEKHDADTSVASALANTPVTLPALDRLAESLQGEVLDLAIQWVAHGCAARSLAKEIETAAGRIYELVSAVKGFTHMDQETAAQPVDVGQDLENTVTMLRAKVKAKSASVHVTVDPALPRVSSYGGELGQVWMNLIDNALDAVAAGGRVEVSARAEGGSVVVKVADDGAGIPETDLPRIFDPFFTTKPVGQGTGLGLDIVRRLLARHNAAIEVDSHPGRTVFTVALPTAATK